MLQGKAEAACTACQRSAWAETCDWATESAKSAAGCQFCAPAVAFCRCSLARSQPCSEAAAKRRPCATLFSGLGWSHPTRAVSTKHSAASSPWAWQQQGVRLRAAAKRLPAGGKQDEREASQRQLDLLGQKIQAHQLDREALCLLVSSVHARALLLVVQQGGDGRAPAGCPPARLPRAGGCL